LTLIPRDLTVTTGYLIVTILLAHFFFPLSELFLVFVPRQNHQACKRIRIIVSFKEQITLVVLIVAQAWFLLDYSFVKFAVETICFLFASKVRHFLAEKTLAAVTASVRSP
jgi:hypothetical protein